MPFFSDYYDHQSEDEDIQSHLAFLQSMEDATYGTNDDLIESSFFDESLLDSSCASSWSLNNSYREEQKESKMPLISSDLAVKRSFQGRCLPTPSFLQHWNILKKIKRSWKKRACNKTAKGKKTASPMEPIMSKVQFVTLPKQKVISNDMEIDAWTWASFEFDTFQLEQPGSIDDTDATNNESVIREGSVSL